MCSTGKLTLVNTHDPDQRDMFVTAIHLGNAAMRRPSHVAAALRVLAAVLEEGTYTDSNAVSIEYRDTGWCGNIRDENGNWVGEWQYNYTSPDDESEDE